MRIGIMQPYFFPYLGYFELIEKTDIWVIFDSVKYNARSWMTRNRILHPDNGDQYIGVPVVKAPFGTRLRDVILVDKPKAQQKIERQLAHYRKHAPYFDEATHVVRQAFSQSTGDRLVDINISTLKSVCDYLGIFFAPISYILPNLEDNIAHAGQWALKISEYFNATEYINPPGGRMLFDPLEWRRTGISLRFTQLKPLEYNCKPYQFVENLSILDVMMWNSPQEIRNYLRSKPLAD